MNVDKLTDMYSYLIFGCETANSVLKNIQIMYGMAT